jgi:hypothetical protein
MLLERINHRKGIASNGIEPGFLMRQQQVTKHKKFIHSKNTYRCDERDLLIFFWSSTSTAKPTCRSSLSERAPQLTHCNDTRITHPKFFQVGISKLRSRSNSYFPRNRQRIHTIRPLHQEIIASHSIHDLSKGLVRILQN